MKIGILTQPLGTNYGGLLQAYALQTVLKRLGHEPWILCRIAGSPLKLALKRNIKRALGYKVEYGIRKEEAQYISRHTQQFIDTFIIPHTEPIHSSRALQKTSRRLGLQAYVVGSDQVWRPLYSPCIEDYFLKFDKNSTIKRYAYAASFGIDRWEFTRRQTRRCAMLAKRFDAVSVRESSGVDLSKKHFNIAAQHVLDPTMLLDREDYGALVTAVDEPRSSGDLFFYILDETTEITTMISSIGQATRLQPFTQTAKRKITSRLQRENIEEYVYPAVTKWLRAFMDCKMVITDSFHGTVFSIIFNKPFWVLGNVSRGNARFQSLLSLFGLEERVIDAGNSTSVDWNAPIDWVRVNAICQQLKCRSFDFIKQIG